MAMNTGGGRGALSDINVTPLVDVMLVLLIVFMVTTPIIVDEAKPRKVEVDLPNTASNTPLKPSDIQQLVMNLTADFRITMASAAALEDPAAPPSVAGAPSVPDFELVNCTAAAASQDFQACLQPLEDKLRANPKVQTEKKVFLQADRHLPYGFVIDVMARIRNAGVTGLGMVTNPPAGATGGSGDPAGGPGR